MIILLKILLLFNTFFAIYLWILALFGIRVKRSPDSKKFNKFAVIIPAHNEENVIETALESLNNINYPKENFDCYFGADHCTDKTAEKITSKGFVCFEKQDNLKGKGRMLAWLTDKIISDTKNKYDALCYFDADNYIEPNFLNVINNSMNAGNNVVQGYVGILNKDDSAFSLANYLNFATINRLKQNGRNSAGLSCHLHGLGMCFKIDVLKKFKWPLNSTTEDQELLLDLIIAGEKITWEHNAKLYSKISSNAASSEKQRMRWSSGKNELFKKKAFPLLKRAITKFDLSALDAFIEFLMPPNSFLVGLAIFCTGFSVLLSRSFPVGFWWAIILTATYFAYFMLGAILEKIPLKKLFRCSFLMPFFIFWRARIYLKSLKKTKLQEWK